MELGTTNIFVVKCSQCEAWVRTIASEVVCASESNEEFALRRWCLPCLHLVESLSEEIVKEFNPFNDELPFWSSSTEDEEEEDKDNNDDSPKE